MENLSTKRDFAEFYHQWKEAHGKMQELIPNVMRGFGGLFQAAMKQGALSVREKELIALGVALAERCT